MKQASYVVVLYLLILIHASCSESSPEKTVEPSLSNDATNDQLTSTDAAQGEPLIFEPNPNAKANAFRLYYRERTERLLKPGFPPPHNDEGGTIPRTS
jgi:hypothetical protein